MVLEQFDTLNSVCRIYLQVTYGSWTKHGLRPKQHVALTTVLKRCVFSEKGY